MHTCIFSTASLPNRQPSCNTFVHTRHMKTQKARIIAFHLPQYHPIPENDEWWGKGFTEWTNTAKAKPLFPGHQQPRVPADLGFYDLRLPEARAAQAELAREYGIEAFCYYHYWFAGRRLLELPVNEILSTGQPDFPFCLCWANETWSGIWHGAPQHILIEQTYPGEADHRAHFDYLIRAFMDTRYLKIDGRPLFLIYRAWEIPNIKDLLSLWKTWARAYGIPDIYFIAVMGANRSWNALEHGFDGTTTPRVPLKQPWVSWRNPFTKLKFWTLRLLSLPTIYRYDDIVDDMIDIAAASTDHPCIIPNWDNTPRSGRQGLVLHKSSPQLFKGHIRKALLAIKDKPKQEKIVFLKSWNEWAEGNYVEPDLDFGHAYLEAIRDEVIGPPD